MQQFKVMNDPIHGSIPIPQLCMDIIDTEEFQRLRYLHQLGLTYLVYPGATHTRFEHSIGVCYLAGELIKTLKKSQDDLNITDQDILCVMIAGLCHDLGHGPFSHTWETYMATLHVNWKHETISNHILDYLIKKNNLLEKFRSYSLDKGHIEMIKKIILGEENNSSKAFLYQIVNNKASGCDVDKWDYYLRDCHYLGLKSVFDYRRLILHTRVIQTAEGKKVLGFRDKEYFNIRDMFQMRLMLHRKAYQHRLVKVFEFMLVETLKKYDDLVQNGTWVNWSINAFNGQCQDYIQLTDSVIWNELRFSDNAMIIKLMKPLISRNKKDGIFEVIDSDLTIDINTIDEDFQLYLEANSHHSIQPGDYAIQVVNLHWGKSHLDPLPLINFYSKTDPQKVIHFNTVCARTHQEIKLRLIVKHTATDLAKVWSNFLNSKPPTEMQTHN